MVKMSLYCDSYDNNTNFMLTESTDMAAVKQFFFYFTLFQQIITSFLIVYEDLGQAQALRRVKIQKSEKHTSKHQ